jgi:hypothetical protein
MGCAVSTALDQGTGLVVDASHEYVCAGCSRPSFLLKVVDGQKLCSTCTEKAVRINREMAKTHSEDPVECDGCNVKVSFDAKVAVVIRGCGGFVLCERCKPAAIEGEQS